MNKNKRIYSFLGLAAKANRIISGGTLCENALKYKNVKMVIIAKDASAGTDKKFNKLCDRKNIRPTKFGYKEELGKIIGKTKPRSIICITCKNFAKRLNEMIMDE